MCREHPRSSKDTREVKSVLLFRNENHATTTHLHTHIRRDVKYMMKHSPGIYGERLDGVRIMVFAKVGVCGIDMFGLAFSSPAMGEVGYLRGEEETETFWSFRGVCWDI